MSTAESSRIMYEIYREEGYDRRFRVIYFTELSEHNKEIEINRAMAGSHVHDGFIAERGKEAAKEAIASFVARLNAGEPASTDELEATLEGIGD